MSVPPFPDDLPLVAYLDRVASDDPTPGGGSVVGVAGALAAALGEMVCRLSLRRIAPTGGAAAGDLYVSLERFGELRGRLLAAAAADEAAYAAYRTAAALPRTGTDEQAARKAAMAEALVAAIEVPLGAAEACRDALLALRPVAEHGKRALRSDVAIAAILAEAALRGALATVRGNVGALRDDPRATAFAARADTLEREGTAALAKALAPLDAPPIG